MSAKWRAEGDRQCPLMAACRPTDEVNGELTHFDPLRPVVSGSFRASLLSLLATPTTDKIQIRCGKSAGPNWIPKNRILACTTFGDPAIIVIGINLVDP
jgi:hypothetical protein